MDLEIATADELRDVLAAEGVTMQATGASIEVATHFRAVQLTPQLSLSEMTGEVSGVLRTASRVNSAYADLVTFAIRGSGDATTLEPTDRGTRTETIMPGQAILYDHRSPSIAHHPSWSDTICLNIDRSWLVSAAGGRLPLFNSFSAQSPLVPVLTTFLRQTINAGDALTATEAAILAETSVDLLAAVLGSVVAGEDVAPTGRQALLRALLADVDQRVGDPHLSPTNLAARHRISLRYVHSLFSDIDTTPAGYIRERRLRQAESMLVDPAHLHMPIAAIAHFHGFGDQGTFVRAFRRHFGVTPTDRRRLAR